jgi:hypothetical protein
MLLGVVVVCLPMLVMGWLLLAARWTKMDALTMRMPIGVRSTIAQIAMQSIQWGKGQRPEFERVNRIDPANADAWSGRCTSYFGESERSADVATCITAVKVDASAATYDGLGDAQQRAGDVCAAEESFTRAASVNSGTHDYEYTERMGRAALRCGHLPSARAGLEVAVQHEDYRLKQEGKDDDEIDDTKTDMLKDREFLVVVYQKLHEDALAKKACAEAHSDWKGCACAVDAKTVTCEEAKR